MNVRPRNAEENEVVQRRQQEELEDGDGYYVHTRAEDRSFWLRISYILEKYRLLWYILTGVLVSMGFNFKTPAQTTHELSARIDMVSVRVDSISADNRRSVISQDKLDSKLDMLLKFQCLSQAQRDLTLAGVDCARLGVIPPK